MNESDVDSRQLPSPFLVWMQPSYALTTCDNHGNATARDVP